MNSQWTKPKDFSPHNSSICDLKTIFERGRAEYDEIPKSSFPFQPQTKNGKKYSLTNPMEDCAVISD
jgi:hypothetical protein